MLFLFNLLKQMIQQGYLYFRIFIYEAPVRLALPEHFSKKVSLNTRNNQMFCTATFVPLSHSIFQEKKHQKINYSHQDTFFQDFVNAVLFCEIYLKNYCILPFHAFSRNLEITGTVLSILDYGYPLDYSNFP